MGANVMQRQAVPTLRADEAAGGYRYGAMLTAVDSMLLRYCKRGGTWLFQYVDASSIVIKVNEDEMYRAKRVMSTHLSTPAKYTRSNQNTCINQAMCVSGRPVELRRRAGERSVHRHLGELALGQEHARGVHAVEERLQLPNSILVSSVLSGRDRFTTIHVIQNFGVRPVTPSWGRKRSPLISRTWVRSCALQTG